MASTCTPSPSAKPQAARSSSPATNDLGPRLESPRPGPRSPHLSTASPWAPAPPPTDPEKSWAPASPLGHLAASQGHPSQSTQAAQASPPPQAPACPLRPQAFTLPGSSAPTAKQTKPCLDSTLVSPWGCHTLFSGPRLGSTCPASRKTLLDGLPWAGTLSPTSDSAWLPSTAANFGVPLTSLAGRWVLPAMCPLTLSSHILGTPTYTSSLDGRTMRNPLRGCLSKVSQHL